MERGLDARKPKSPEEVALRRDQAGDRTQERNRSGIIDALRAVAALMVVVDHASLLAVGQSRGPVATALVRMLAAGIYLFFVVSGYLIAGPFLRALVGGHPLPDTKTYFVRRAARIYPGYWVAFAAMAILLAPATGIRAYQWPVHILLLQTLWPHLGESEAIFAVAWTLGIEVVFYGLVPLAARVLRAWRPGPWPAGRLAAIVLAIFVANVLWMYVTGLHFGASTSTGAVIAQRGPEMWLYAFCPGIMVALAALVDVRRRPWRSVQQLFSRPTLCLSAAVLLWPCAYAMSQSGSLLLTTVSGPAYAVACGLILGCAVVAGSWIDGVVRLLAPIGLISYGIYLWHWVVINALLTHTSVRLQGVGLPWLVDALLVLAITLPLAALSWFGVERPLMRQAAAWARRRIGLRPQAVAISGVGPTGT